ncbi:MAG TPA: oligosaccharide repeat unit polymerase, partial [Bryobacteraceae bacterium]
RSLWWLNPAWVAGLLGAGVSAAAYLIPETMYRDNWRTPKYFDAHFLQMTLLLTLMFVLGAASSTVLARGQRIRDWKVNVPWDSINWWFRICVGLSIAGYLAWGAVAVARGATLALAMGVLRGEKGAASQMKEVYLGTISGVTTLTQLGIVAIVLGVMIGVAQGWRKVRWPMTVLLMLAVVRALMNSERLAIIELAIPFLVLGLRLAVFESPRFTGRLRTLLRFVPLAGAGLVLGLFSLFEYFRSWSSYYAGGPQGFWPFAGLRLLGYYVTALNNGALMVARIDPVWAPFASLHFLWRFPVISSLTQAIYPSLKLDNIDWDPYMQILDREANPEFNNSSALLPPVVDFGFAGALLFWLAAGLLCGLLYRWYVDGKIGGLLFYPVFFTGIIETTRIMYWGEGRAAIVYLVLIPIAWMCTIWARRAQRVERRFEWQQSH